MMSDECHGALDLSAESLDFTHGFSWTLHHTHTDVFNPRVRSRLRFRPIQCRHVRFAPPLNLPIPFSNFRLHSGRSVTVPVLFWMSYSTHESHCFYSRLNVRPFRLPLLWPLLTSATASDLLPLFVVPKNTVTDLPRYDALLSHFTCQIYLATMSRLSIGFEYESPLPRSPSTSFVKYID